MEEKREEKRDIVFIKSLNEISKAKKVDALLDEVQKSLKVLSEMSKTVNGKVKALSATETQEVVPVKETVEPTEEVKEEVKDPEPKVEETVAYEEKETTPVVALPATSVVSAPSSKVEVTTPIVVAVPSDIVPVEVEEEKEVEVEEPVEETET